MAMLELERVWIGRDNTVDLILKQNGTAVDLAGVTRMDLILGTASISSTSASAGIITWAQPGYATGEARVAVGHSTAVNAGRFEGTLIVYDGASTLGIVWGDEVPLQILANPAT